MEDLSHTRSVWHNSRLLERVIQVSFRGLVDVWGTSALIPRDKEKAATSIDEAKIPVCTLEIEGPRNIDSQY